MTREAAAGGMPIFVISLRDDERRRQSIARHLGALGLAFEFFDAVDGRSGMPALRREERLFADECLRRYPFYRTRALSSLEVGCYLSHLRLVQRCLAQGMERALILEDDALGADDLPAVLRAVSALPSSCELIRLHITREFVAVKTVAPLLDGRRALCRLWPVSAGSAMAYAISRPGMEKFARRFVDIRHPIDLSVDQAWETGLRCYVVRPAPVRHNPALASHLRAGLPRGAASPSWPARLRGAFYAGKRHVDRLRYIARRPGDFI